MHKRTEAAAVQKVAVASTKKADMFCLRMCQGNWRSSQERRGRFNKEEGGYVLPPFRFLKSASVSFLLDVKNAFSITTGMSGARSHESSDSNQRQQNIAVSSAKYTTPATDFIHWSLLSSVSSSLAAGFELDVSEETDVSEDSDVSKESDVSEEASA